MRNFYKLIHTSDTSKLEIEDFKSQKLLKVKSNKQLFLVQDITNEVDRLLDDVKSTKSEFDYIYRSLSKHFC